MASSRTPADARNAMQAAFSAHWTGAGEPLGVIAWDNLDFDTKGRDEWLRFTFLHAAGTLAALGNTCYERTATVTAQVFVREGKGRTRSDTMVETVLEFFETLALAGFSLLDGPGAIDAGVDAGWLQVNVTASFRYESART